MLAPSAVVNSGASTGRPKRSPHVAGARCDRQFHWSAAQSLKLNGSVQPNYTRCGPIETMSERAKVIFYLEKGELPYETESVWAERLPDNRFRILNSPFFAFGVSYEYEVEAEPDGERFRFV